MEISSRKGRMMRRFLVPAAAAALVLVACGSEDDPAAPADDLPEYEVTVVIDPGELFVATDETDPDQLRAVFDYLRDEHTDGDAWSVTISCASIPAGPPNDMGRVLATGRFANSDLGLAQTGLESTDDAVFEPHDNDPDRCTPAPSSPAGAVTGADVVAAVEAAGLEVVNPRDNTQNCGVGEDDLHCTEHLTTDLFSVRVWATPEDAQHWVQASVGDAPLLLGEVTTVDFQEGGTTPAYDRVAYEAALAGLADA